MPEDPGLSNPPNPDGDSCIKINPGSPWWESGDIELNPAGDAQTPAGTTPGLAQVGQNLVRVRVRRSSNGCAPTAFSASAWPVLVDLFVSNPNLGVIPSKARQITNVAGRPNARINEVDFPGISKELKIQWDVPNLGGDDPESAGHKCLVARCYPTGLTPDPNNTDSFFRQMPPGDPGDQHVAQRNICIQVCNSPCGLVIEAVNVNLEEVVLATFEAIPVLKPSRRLLRLLLPMLRGYEGFAGFAENLPPPFALEFENLDGVEIVDRTRPGKREGWFGRRRTPHFTAQVKLEPAQPIRLNFATDLEETEYGQAHIYRITQRDNNKELIVGGLTLVMLRVKG